MTSTSTYVSDVYQTTNAALESLKEGALVAEGRVVSSSYETLASDLSWSLVTAHQQSGCQVVHGNAERVLGIEKGALEAQGLAAFVVGSIPSPCPWLEACEASVYLLRDQEGLAGWVESSSRTTAEGALVVSTHRAGLVRELDQLSQLARLSFGGSLIGGMAHELNNIVQGMSSADYLFRDCLDNGEEIDREDLDQLTESIAELKALASDAQGFSRLGVVAPEPVDLEHLVRRAAGLLRSFGKLKTIALELDFAEDLPLLLWSKFELDLVVLTLLVNAAEAAVASGDEQSVRVTLVAEHEALVLRFYDSGPGLELHEVSAPFVSTKSVHRNAGLGLSAARALVASHGGHISAAQSESGTLVAVHLPLS